MSPLVEIIGSTLVKGVLGEVAGSVRRKLSGDPAQSALKKAVSQALEDALRQSGLSPEILDHSESFFRDLFSREAVQLELALLLDPRPDLSLDLDRLAHELEEAGLDHATLSGFDLKKFLGAFAVAFYSAAGKQDALRGVLDLKLLGLMVDRLGMIARSSDRMADGVDRLNENVEGLRRELPEFVAGRIGEAALSAAVYALGSAGMIPAFDGLRLLQMTVNEAGYDVEVDPEGRLRIAGQPSEERALPPARLGALERVAAELRRAVDVQKPNSADLDALAERYRQHIVRWFQHLSFQGMTPTARAIVLPLEEVYVELRAVAEVPEAADSFSVDERRVLLEADERDPKAKDDLLRRLDVLRRERWGRTIPERKSIAAALYQRDQQAFVILGDPGSGKSTLLHFLALVHARGAETAASRLEIDAAEADRLPIFVSLAAFDDMLRENPGLTLLEFLPRYYDRRRGLPGLGPLFLRVLETGRALVLLDGLDEVLNSGTRSYVAQQTGALIGEWHSRGVRFAVSSRFVGYREAPVPGNLPTLSVLDFGEKEIEVFVHRWAHAYEKWSAGEESPEALRRARDLERELLVDVQSNESVRRLAANPLMLTLLALLRRQVGRLPHRRVQLYEAYVSTMLDNWLEARSQGAREKAIDALDRHQAENILIPMALWLQREKPSGTAGRVELETKLTDICLREKGCSWETATVPQLREAEDKARRFLREMREIAGLIVERGHDAFGFLHLTFQEYFTGRELARLDAKERWEVIRPHLHNPRWREPILLSAGRLGVVENRRKEVSDFVSLILDCADPTEDYLHRKLLLALAVASDDVNLDPALKEVLLSRALTCISPAIAPLAQEFFRYLAQLIANGGSGASIRGCLVPSLASNSLPIKEAIIESLGVVGNLDQSRKLLLRLTLGRAESLRRPAAEALAGWVNLDMDIRNVLLEHLRHEEFTLREASILALSKAAMTNTEVRRALLEKLGDIDYDVRLATVNSLAGQFGDELVRRALLERLNDSHSNVAEAVVVGIARFPANEDVYALLIKRLKQGKYVGETAILYLSRFVETKLEARTYLLKLLNDSSDKLREAAAKALAPLARSSEEIRSALVKKLTDSHESVRLAAASSLASTVVISEPVRVAFRKLLSDASVEVRRISFRSLATVERGSRELMTALRQQAQSWDWLTRRFAIEMLTELPDYQCVELMEVQRNVIVAEAADSVVAWGLRALARIPLPVGPFKEFMLSKFRDSDINVRVLAVEASVGMIEDDLDLRSAVFGATRSGEPIEVRASALRTISHLVAPGNYIHKALSIALFDSQSLIRAAALFGSLKIAECGSDVLEAGLNGLDDKYPWVLDSAAKLVSHCLSKRRGSFPAVMLKLDLPKAENRRATVNALSCLARDNDEVRSALLSRMKDDEPEVQESAIDALAGLYDRFDEVRIALIQMCSHSNIFIQAYVVRALSPWTANKELRSIIFEKIKNSPVGIRAAALAASSDLAASDSMFREAVISELNSDSFLLRQAAVRALVKLAKTTPSVSTLIMARLTDEEFSVRLTAVEAILDAGVEDGSNLLSIKEWIQMDADSLYYYTRPTDNWKYDTFLKSVEDVRFRLAAHLGDRLPEDKALLNWILDLLQNDSWKARLGGVITLLNWPGGMPPELGKKALKVFSDRRGLESYPARLTAASLLIDRNEDRDSSIGLCLKALDYGAQPWEGLGKASEVRKQAALILSKLEQPEYNERIFDRLLRVMKDDRDHEVRNGAYNALVRLAGARDRQAEGT